MDALTRAMELLQQLGMGSGKGPAPLRNGGIEEYVGAVSGKPNMGSDVAKPMMGNLKNMPKPMPKDMKQIPRRK